MNSFSIFILLLALMCMLQTDAELDGGRRLSSKAPSSLKAPKATKAPTSVSPPPPTSASTTMEVSASVVSIAAAFAWLVV